MTNPKTELIGIMADSHGHPDQIESAISFLRKRGCRTIYHLGDICDSNRLDEVEPCVTVLINNAIRAIKGNNDHVIAGYHLNDAEQTIAKSCLEYLNTLPIVSQWRYGVFTHSLPFEKELGLSCLIRALSDQEVRLFFNRFPGRTLFRGHSHSAEIINLFNGKVTREPLSIGQRTHLSEKHPRIITCGALSEGLCAIWDVYQDILTSYSFFSK